jgi:ATP-dependent helicase/nuclease subunit B
MTQITKSTMSDIRAFNYPKEHAAIRVWLDDGGLLDRIHKILIERNHSPSRCIVLLPFIQLLHMANRMWLSSYPNSLMPRFETTASLANGLAALAPDPTDVHFDYAIDQLTVQAMLLTMGVTSNDHLLLDLTIRNAYQLAPLAAAQIPKNRSTWTSEMLQVVHEGFIEHPAFDLELQAAQLAITWVGQSSYRSDVLYQAEAIQMADSLILVEGGLTDPMATGLLSCWGERFMTLPLMCEKNGAIAHKHIGFHACLDIHAEVEQVVTCVLDRIRNQQYPVALVSSDRSMTRRVNAILRSAGVAIRDENGWKCSTSVAGANIVAMLKIMRMNPSLNEIMAFLKVAPVFDETIDEQEQLVRRSGIRHWCDFEALATSKPILAETVAVVTQLQQLAKDEKNIVSWVHDFSNALEICGLLDALETMNSGPAIKLALHLDNMQNNSSIDFANNTIFAQLIINFDAFCDWVRGTLENTNCQEIYPDEEQAVILPMKQLSGRAFASVVFMGCDEISMPACPETNDKWTPQLREALGLPSRQHRELTEKFYWRHALDAPTIDIFWRKFGANGAPLAASSRVLLLQFQLHAQQIEFDLPKRLLLLNSSDRPRPMAPQLLPSKISASAYEDLRTCPYRFFALRQLDLHEANELDIEVEKKDYGIWLHKVLHRFHTRMKESNVKIDARDALLNEIGLNLLIEKKLSHAEFLPYLASWPQVRSGYLAWLLEHEEAGYGYVDGEIQYTRDVRGYTLTGRFDRLDKKTDGSYCVLDYKTGAIASLKKKVNDPLEDTQMLFYGLLLDKAAVDTCYLSIADKGVVESVVHIFSIDESVMIEDGLVSDLQKISAGHVLQALGDGQSCDYCEARGLCRKDFWS